MAITSYNSESANLVAENRWQTQNKSPLHFPEEMIPSDFKKHHYEPLKPDSFALKRAQATYFQGDFKETIKAIDSFLTQNSEVTEINSEMLNLRKEAASYQQKVDMIYENFRKGFLGLAKKDCENLLSCFPYQPQLSYYKLSIGEAIKLLKKIEETIFARTINREAALNYLNEYLKLCPMDTERRNFLLNLS